MAIVIGAALIAWSNRYSTSGGDLGFVVDNFTGRIWACNTATCYQPETQP
ncbi:hypothetical protein [Alterinioella nitratireducens]|nr:hypothetical protein [Alterinioella nitratireducens]NPD21738.1 hypothetical protein [Alterinioella nitratireducens]